MLQARLEEHLLAVVASVSWDGGDGVVGVLRALLAEAAPFDAGEVAVAHPAGFHRWTLTDDESPLVGEDLLLHLSARPHPVRLDDWREAEPWPRTAELLERRGLRSLMVLPLSAAGGAEGGVGVACRHGWAFVGCSLRRLQPVAAMAGLALAHARALTALRRHETVAERAEPAPAALDVSPDLQRRLSEIRISLHELRAALERERARGSELAAREARWLEEREALERELAELRQKLSGRQDGPPPFQGGGRRGRR